MSEQTTSIAYVGWIPTVSGRLSFSEFGNADYPTPCIRSVCTDGANRVILNYQKRNLSDTTIPIVSQFPILKNFFDKIILRKDGSLWFCSTTFYDPENNLIYGKVFVFDKACWREKSEYLVRNKMDLFPASNGNVEFIKEQLISLEGEIKNLSSTTLDYNIKRSGKVEITFSACSQGESYVNAVDEDIDEDIITQVYYYLKDCLHKHQHHSKNTDSILQIYNKENVEDWKLETLYTLYRKIISRRRSKTIVDLSESLGVIAYANAFEKIFATHFSAMSDRVVYNKEEIKESIKATIYSLENTKTRFSIIYRDAAKSTLATGAILISAFALISLTGKKIDVNPDKILLFLAKEFVKSPAEWFFYLFVSLFLLFGFCHTKDIFREVYKDAIRLCIAGGKATVLAFFVLSIVIYITSLILIYSSIF